VKKEPKIRILIADDHFVVRMGLTALVNTEPDMKIVAEAHDGAQAVELFDKFNPDLVLMDMRMPVRDGIWATVEIIRKFAKARILMLTTYDGDDDIHRALQAGAAGNWNEQKEICMAMVKAMAGGSREDAYSSKLAINEAGYCYAGPPRPPYRILKPDAQARAKECAKRWRDLCERYPIKTSAAA